MGSWRRAARDRGRPSLVSGAWGSVRWTAPGRWAPLVSGAWGPGSRVAIGVSRGRVRRAATQARVQRRYRQMHAKHADGAWATAAPRLFRLGRPVFAANEHAGLRPIRVLCVHLFCICVKFPSRLAELVGKTGRAVAAGGSQAGISSCLEGRRFWHEALRGSMRQGDPITLTLDAWRLASVCSAARPCAVGEVGVLAARA